MLLKPRTTPPVILQLEALLRRLAETHPAFPAILKDLATQRKGYRGEQNLDHYLSFYSAGPHATLQGLRLPDDLGGHFQMDSLLMDSRFYCIFEVKNWSGTVSFNPALKQVTRIVAGEEEGYSDPISQVKLQKTHFISWLERHRLPVLPVYEYVVMSHPSTRIQIENNHCLVAGTVIHAHAALEHLEKINPAHSHERIDKRALRKIGRMVNKQHVPRYDNLLKKYGVTSSDLITGVRCEACNIHGMQREHGRWRCLACGSVSKEAHIKALEEYRLLIGDTITNGQARWFLRLEDLDAMTYILRKLNSPSYGSRRKRTYDLSNHFSG